MGAARRSRQIWDDKTERSQTAPTALQVFVLRAHQDAFGVCCSSTVFCSVEARLLRRVEFDAARPAHDSRLELSIVIKRTVFTALQRGARPGARRI